MNRPWSNIYTAHQLIKLLFENPTRGSKAIERTRKRDRRAKTLSPYSKGGRHNNYRNNKRSHGPLNFTLYSPTISM